MPGFKRSLSSKTIGQARIIFQAIRDLYSNLTDSTLRPVLQTRRKCAFYGLLSAIDASERLYHYMDTGLLSMEYLSTYKFIQDHLEIFFNGIRLRNGWSFNPTPRQFRAAFRQLTVHAGKNILGSLSANCVAQDETAVLLVHSSNIMAALSDDHLEEVLIIIWHYFFMESVTNYDQLYFRLRTLLWEKPTWKMSTWISTAAPCLGAMFASLDWHTSQDTWRFQ